jgi:hypothetical protein
MKHLSTADAFKLGNAYGSFSSGQFTEAIHITLPTHNTDDPTKKRNEVFVELHAMYDKVQAPTNIEAYLGAIQKFAKRHNVDIGDWFIEDYDKVA